MATDICKYYDKLSGRFADLSEEGVRGPAAGVSLLLVSSKICEPLGGRLRCLWRPGERVLRLRHPFLWPVRKDFPYKPSRDLVNIRNVKRKKKIARAQARRVRGSHVADMAATLSVDLRTVAREVADGSAGDSETLQAQLQGACKKAIDVYVSQQGDEGRSAIAFSLKHKFANESCIKLHQESS